MHWLKNALSRIASFFTSGRAKQALNDVADFVPVALPYIDIAARIVSGVTPTTLDDAAVAAVHNAFPGLFDGSVKNGDELKLYALGVATELLQAKYPNVSTSIARAAVQLAYVGQRADK